jgi:hypothetical protein
MKAILVTYAIVAGALVSPVASASASSSGPAPARHTAQRIYRRGFREAVEGLFGGRDHYLIAGTADLHSLAALEGRAVDVQLLYREPKMVKAARQVRKPNVAACLLYDNAPREVMTYLKTEPAKYRGTKRRFQDDTGGELTLYRNSDSMGRRGRLIATAGQELTVEDRAGRTWRMGPDLGRGAVLVVSTERAAR